MKKKFHLIVLSFLCCIATVNAMDIIHAEGYIYFTEDIRSNSGILSGTRIWRTRTNGSNKESLYISQKNVIKLHDIDNDWLYFTISMEGERLLHKTKVGSGKIEKISDISITFLKVYKNTLYYQIQDGTTYSLYKMDTDGSNNRSINEKMKRVFSIVDDSIYAIKNDGHPECMQKSDLSGNIIFNVETPYAESFTLYDNEIYVITRSRDAVYKMKSDGSSFTKLTGHNGISIFPELARGKVYWNDSQWNVSSGIAGGKISYGHIFLYDPVTGTVQNLYNAKPSRLEAIVDDVIYFTVYDEGIVRNYQMDLDGNNVKTRLF